MASPKSPTDSTGSRSLIGPKPEDPVGPPRRDGLIGPKPEDPHSIRDAVTPAGRGVGGKLPTPGGPKPR